MPYKDKEQEKTHSREYYLRNKEHFSEYNKKKYLEKGEEIKRKVQEYYFKNREKISLNSKKRYELNKERVTEVNKKWAQNNREKVRAIKAKYRNTLKGKISHKRYIQKNRVKRNEKRRKWRAANPDKVKAGKLRQRFKISFSDYQLMMKDQKNQCGICQTFFSTKSNSMAYSCVDHNHDTSKVRGLLCRRCNSGIGGFKDDPELLLSALNWLKGIKSKEEGQIERKPLKHYKYLIKRQYGLNEDQFYDLIDFQGNKCGICKIPLDKVQINIDHDHETGQIRGILCDKCNRSLGLLLDSPIIILKAIEWLKKEMK
jgi:hypothetical protein